MAKADYRHRETYNGVKIDLTAPSQRKLDEKVRQRKNEIDEGISHSTKIPTVKAWGDKWLEVYKKPHIVNKSYNTYKNLLEKYIYPHIGVLPLDTVTNIDLREIILSQSGRSKSHVSHLRCTITGMFKEAQYNKLIKDNPAIGLQIPDDVTEGTHRPLTAAEEKAFFVVCETHYLGLFLLIMYYCGLRPSEIAALKWKDYDKDKSVLHVRAAIASGTREEKSTKTKSGDRYIPVPEVLTAKLNAVIGTPEDNIVHDLQGRVMTDDRFFKYFEFFRRLWDIEMGAEVKNHKVITSKFAEPMSSYCLRHTYCTNLLRAGVPITTAKYLMGHKDIRMVDRVYGHHTDDQTETARILLNSFFNTKVGTNVGTGDTQQQNDSE